MVRDRRYKTIKNLIESGHITAFCEIFDTLPKSVLYQDLGINHTRFTKLLENVELFMLNDLFRIADLLDTDKTNIVELVLKQYDADNRLRKRSSRRGSSAGKVNKKEDRG